MNQPRFVATDRGAFHRFGKLGEESAVLCSGTNHVDTVALNKADMERAADEGVRWILLACPSFKAKVDGRHAMQLLSMGKDRGTYVVVDESSLKSLEQPVGTTLSVGDHESIRAWSGEESFYNPTLERLLNYLRARGATEMVLNVQDGTLRVE